MVMVLIVGFLGVVIVGRGRRSTTTTTDHAHDDDKDVDNAPPSVRSSSLFRDSHLLYPTVGPVISSSSERTVRCTPMVEISTTTSSKSVLFVGVRIDLDAQFDWFKRYELRGSARSVRFGLQQTSVQKTEPAGAINLARSSVHEITVEDDSELRDTWKEGSGYVRLFYTPFVDSPYWDVRFLRENMVNPISPNTPMEYRLLDSATTEPHTLVVNHLDRINTFHPISARGYVHDGIRHIHLIPRTDTTTMWRRQNE